MKNQIKKADTMSPKIFFFPKNIFMTSNLSYDFQK